MKYSLFLVGTAICGMLVPVAASAQDASRTTDQATATQGEYVDKGDIIVTARKRQESLLNVPVIETALPKAQLDRIQFHDLTDLNSRVPGLSLGASNLSIGTQVSLRGVGTNSLSAGIEQSTALNIDGMQLTTGLAYQGVMFDIGQIEVLKGPQSLFYGKNSPAGVISIRTADPTDETDVSFRYGHEFEARENRIEAIISGPLSDQLKVRIAGQYDESQGYFHNDTFPTPGLGGKGNPSGRSPYDESYVLRGTLLWNPSDVFDARLKGTITRDRQEYAGYEQFTSCTNQPAFGIGINFIGPNENCKLDRHLGTLSMDPAAFPGIPNNGITFADTTQKYTTLEMNLHVIPNVTLTSQTGYYDVHNSGLITAQFSTAAGPEISAENPYFKRREFTQEFRANSDFSGPLNFSAGAFYQNGDVKNATIIRFNQAIAPLVSAATGGLVNFPAIISDNSQHMKIRSYSLFGQVRYQVVPQLELALGGRWQHERRSDTATFFGANIPLPEPVIKSNNFSPEVTVTYKPSDDITIFGSYKKGFKSGSFDITTSPVDPVTFAPVDISFGDESTKGFELGVKARLLDRQLTTNLAFYDYNYNGLQVGISESGTTSVRTLNAGSSKIYGIDFDLAYRPASVEGLEVHTSVEWNHARFKQLDGIACWGGQLFSEGCNQGPRTNRDGTPGFTAQSLAGYPLLRAPDWQVNGGFSYEHKMADGGSILFASDSQYSSRYLTVLGTHRSDFFQPAFFKTDASLTYRSPTDRWEFALIGKNLTDKLTRDNCSGYDQHDGLLSTVFGSKNKGGTTRGPGGKDDVACFISRGREIWLRLTIRPFK